MENKNEQKDRVLVELPENGYSCFNSIDNGIVVRCKSEDPVYFIQNGYRHRIPNPKVFNDLFINWNAIKILDKNDIDKIPLGIELSTDSCLIRVKGADPIYLYSNGTKSHVRCMKDVKGANLNLDKCHYISQSEMDNIKSTRDFIVEEKKEIVIDPIMVQKIEDRTSYGILESFPYVNHRKSISMCHVLRPENYLCGGEYPVLYLYHGYGGNNEWIRSGNMQNIMGYMISQKMIPEMIIVMPDIITPECEMPAMLQDEYEEFMSRFEESGIVNDPKTEERVKDFQMFYKSLGAIMKRVEDAYPVLKGKKNTAIAGLSLGATAALYNASLIDFKDRFNFVGAFSPVKRLLRSNDVNGWIKDDKDFVLGTDESFFSFIGCGRGDDCFDCAKYYSSILNINKVEHLFETLEGKKHDWDTFKKLFYTFMFYDFFRKC